MKDRGVKLSQKQKTVVIFIEIVLAIAMNIATGLNTGADSFTAMSAILAEYAALGMIFLIVTAPIAINHEIKNSEERILLTKNEKVYLGIMVTLVAISYVLVYLYLAGYDLTASFRKWLKMLEPKILGFVLSLGYIVLFLVALAVVVFFVFGLIWLLASSLASCTEEKSKSENNC